MSKRNRLTIGEKRQICVFSEDMRFLLASSN